MLASIIVTSANAHKGYKLTLRPFVCVHPQRLDCRRAFVETAKELVPDIDAMDEMIAKELASEGEVEARRRRGGNRTEFRVRRARAWGNVILQAFSDVVARGLSLSPGDRPAVGGTEWPPVG